MSGYANLVYAVRDGSIVHIDDVDNGVGCRCVCPECGEDLIARQGGVRAWHFAHISGAECVTAPETALHRFAKCWFSAQKHLIVPAVIGKYRNSKHIISKQRRVVVQAAFVEKSFGSVIPDVYIELSDGGKLFIEIFVTHAIDFDKRAKLSELAIPTLELDLSDIDRDLSPSDLESVLKDVLRDAVWAYHPEIDRYVEACRESEREKLAVRKKMRDDAASQDAVRNVDKSVGAVLSAADQGAGFDASGFESNRTPESDVFGRRDALAAVYAKIEEDRKARAEAERQAMIQKAEQNRAEYLSKDAVGRLLHGPRCLACGGDLRHFSDCGEFNAGEYCCSECGRLWSVDPIEITFKLSDGYRICPECGCDMVKRNGRRGPFWGCSCFPQCRHTCPT